MADVTFRWDSEKGKWVTDPLTHRASRGEQVTFHADGTRVRFWFPMGSPFELSGPAPIHEVEKDDTLALRVKDTAALQPHPYAVYCEGGGGHSADFNGRPQIIIKTDATLE